MLYRFLIAFTALSLGACTTVIEDSMQSVHVETPGAEGALCYMLRPGYRQKVYPPQTVKLTKSKDDIEMRCIAPGNREKTVIVKPEVSDTIFANISNGLIPGMLWDYESGAMFRYPEMVSVDFTQVPAKHLPLPDYQNLLKLNPALADVEEFRPGQSALQRDRYSSIPTLEPRVREQDLIMKSSEYSDVTGGSYTVRSHSGEGTSSLDAQSSTADSLSRQYNPTVFESAVGDPVSLEK